MNTRRISQLLEMFVGERPRAARAVNGRTKCLSATADVMQDTWIKLSTLEDTTAISNPPAFMQRVARNLAVDHYRKERRRTSLDEELKDILWESVDEASPERILMGREMLAAVERKLAELPAQSRDIFLMNRFQGKTHRAIAEELGVSEQTVYYHIRRVLDELGRVRDAFGCEI